jgi:hypothetical protein
MAIIPVFQTGDAGSIPATRSIERHSLLGGKRVILYCVSYTCHCRYRLTCEVKCLLIGSSLL